MKIRSIQSLRALAAILVVYLHSMDLQTSFSHSRQQGFFHLRNFGAFGVDIFFVISGFIIPFAAAKYKGLQDSRTFLIKRFIRVNPIYYLATLLYLALAFHTLSQGPSPIFTIHKLVNSIVLLPLLDHSAYTPPILGLAWTLSFEWWFYLLFAVAILFRNRLNLPPAAILLPLLLLLSTPFLLLKDTRLIFFTNPLILEFLLGLGIYHCYQSIKISINMALLLLIAGILICIIEIVVGFGTIDEAGYTMNIELSMYRSICWGIPAAMIVAGCIFLERSGAGNPIWKNKWVALIGDASYSIYLFHLSLFTILAGIYTRIGFFWDPDLAIILQVLLAVGFGIAFYRWVEVPLLRRLRKPGNPSIDPASPSGQPPMPAPPASANETR
jgi:exopolysaccharide production protein ExoZ